jgi:cytosine deaminase
VDFKTLPAQPYTLDNVSVPAWALGKEGDLINTSLGVADGKFSDPVGEQIDMQGAMILPAFVDSHTHLDKGHILPRASNPDGTFDGALNTVRVDHDNWSAEDVHARAEFSIKSAYAHGTRAIRSHVDSIGPQTESSWAALSKLRSSWAEKIDIQLVSLVPCEYFDEPEYTMVADLVAENNGVLGFVSYPAPEIKRLLLGHMEAAGKRGLSIDFHTDETMDSSSETLRLIADCVLETGFDKPILVGHCCSLSTQETSRAMGTLDLVAKAGINVVSLPMCNLYLQDRVSARTPRNRGVTLVHEMKARGINVSFASDNTRDPFYAYGDMDMLEVLREATRIAHLDHSDSDWARSFSETPAQVCGFSSLSLQNGDRADFLVFEARNWYELLSRPQSNRIVLRDGKAIDRRLPDYSELDHLFETSS